MSVLADADGWGLRIVIYDRLSAGMQSPPPMAVSGSAAISPQWPLPGGRAHADRGRSPKSDAPREVAARQVVKKGLAFLACSPSFGEVATMSMTARCQLGHVPDALPEATYRSPLIDANGRSALFRLGTVGRFLVTVDEPTVVERASEATDEDVDCLLRGPVAALRCLLSGQFALRGSAVEMRRGALVLCGPALGASTLTAALALRGHRVIADGVVVISGDPPAASPPSEAWPPRITLWPDSVEALGLDASDGQVVRPQVASRSFSLGASPSPEPSPVASVSLLASDHRLNHETELEGSEQLPLTMQVAALLDAQWHRALVASLGMQAQQFSWVTSLAKAVPMVVLGRDAGGVGVTLPTLVGRVERVFA